MTSRNYCVTLWDEDWSVDRVDQTKVRYMAVQKEKCPTTGRLHFQGYVELFKPSRLPGLKKALGIIAWRGYKREGTREQARDYCMKDDTRVDGPWEIGQWIGGQGYRTDVEKVTDMIKEGRTRKEIFEDLPEVYLRLHGGIDKAVALQSKPRMREDLVVTCYWGVPGSGKSYRCAAEADGDAYRWPANCAEPRGYNGERHVIIEEFAGWLPASTLKVVLDKYPCTLKVPYGSVAWNPERIWITSNHDPSAWYTSRVDNEAIMRRLSNVTHFVTRYEVSGNSGPTPVTNSDT